MIELIVELTKVTFGETFLTKRNLYNLFVSSLKFILVLLNASQRISRLKFVTSNFITPKVIVMFCSLVVGIFDSGNKIRHIEAFRVVVEI